MKETVNNVAQGGSIVEHDGRKKLAELKSIILNKGDVERERILSEARVEAEKWTEEQAKQLDTMITVIKADATKRSYEVASRQLVEAETMRDKNRLRMQNELVNKALILLQNALVNFANRPDYDAILTGVAAEVCERFPKGQKVKMRLRAEDASHGKDVANALSLRFTGLDISFDSTPALILGGVFLYSEEEKWRVVADWKTKVEEMADSVAKTVLAEL